MSLLTEAQARMRPRSVCGIASLNLSESELAELDEALASNVSARAIAEAMTARGHAIGQQTIARHRARTCTCR